MVTLYLFAITVLSSSMGVAIAQRVAIKFEYTSLNNRCVGGPRLGLTNTSILLQYMGIGDRGRVPPQEWTDLAALEVTINGNIPVKVSKSFNLGISCSVQLGGVQFRLLQLEHGAGGCNCWSLDSMSVTLRGDEVPVREDDFCVTTGTGLTFCDLGGEEARGLVTRVFYLPGNSGTRCVSNTLLVNQGLPQPSNCSRETPRLEISYMLHMRVENSVLRCHGVMDRREGVEFAIRNDSSTSWTPLQLHYYSADRNSIVTEIIRGHSVTVTGSTTSDVLRQVFVCGDLLKANHIQFRWMSIAFIVGGETNSNAGDMIAISDVNATMVTGNGTVTLFKDTFGDATLNTSVWMSLRGGTVDCQVCTGSFMCRNNYLTLGAFATLVSRDIISRIALTQWFPGLGETPTTATPVKDMEMCIATILSEIEEISEDIADIIDMLLVETDPENQRDVVGPTLLTLFDQFALYMLEDTDNVSTANFGILARVLQPMDEGLITTVDSNFFSNRDFSQRMVLQLPTELIEMFVDMSGREDGGVRIIAAVYYNIASLLPSTRPGKNDSGLASGVISTALQCGETLCDTTSGVNLDSPVIITFQHPQYIQEVLMSGMHTTICVFLNISPKELESLQFNGSISSGGWSDVGCSRNKWLSNSSVTVCECTHLTHFAVLLSAAPPELTPSITLSLQIIDTVGVAISLVAMAITVLTFIIFRSLHNMRSYIHINLCINLGIAQLLFVAGIDRTATDHVPVHCQVIAVFLHYFFLVSFMWMLMEGIVLYIILVRVFITRTKGYILAFTLISYGVPLLYMGLLTLPLGFIITDSSNYGYELACFLNPETHFIWAFILPVLIILIVNMGLFFMSAVVTWKHKKKKKQTSGKDVRDWLKVLASLVVVMGIAWVFGVLIVEVEELLPFAYVYTIIVALQGLWIFLVLVVLPKKVRGEYFKVWKSNISRFSKHSTSERSSKAVDEIISNENALKNTSF